MSWSVTSHFQQQCWADLLLPYTAWALPYSWAWQSTASAPQDDTLRESQIQQALPQWKIYLQVTQVLTQSRFCSSNTYAHIVKNTNTQRNRLEVSSQCALMQKLKDQVKQMLFLCSGEEALHESNTDIKLEHTCLWCSYKFLIPRLHSVNMLWNTLNLSHHIMQKCSTVYILWILILNLGYFFCHQNVFVLVGLSSE